jgi:UDP-N-acetylmuramate dehydrogenase
LQRSDRAELKREAEAVLEMRRKRQPAASCSAGCFFKNPESGRPAGQLIEMAGLKGKKIGGAQVSMQHANFIIKSADSFPAATAADILALMDIVQQRVSEMFGVNLEPEVKIVGV